MCCVCVDVSPCFVPRFVPVLYTRDSDDEYIIIVVRILYFLNVDKFVDLMLLFHLVGRLD